MKKLILLFFLLTINISFCQEDWTNFENETYSIKYPDNWIFDDSGQMQTTFFIYSPLTEGDKFKENINLIIQSLKGANVSMDQYVESSINQTKAMIENGKVIESTGDNKQHTIVLSGDVSGNKLKFKQVLIYKEEVMYILTFSALSSSYDDYLKTSDKIITSFKVK
ncbi:PsbP-related protein [Psychroserpens luteolus]|uniref:PsbP-related protein n=1 Tax=Psychroserpens luteolus TaxID=2855840 RepID=UPI001E5BEEE0|nr:PsbP-related protein [Psychroserpens luteolus]MCD2260285.1 hypothetical protein [Psychroserpens luteolus]